MLRATGGADKGIDGNKLLMPPGGVKGHLCFMRQGAPNVEKGKKRKKNIHKRMPPKKLLSYWTAQWIRGVPDWLKEHIQ